MTTTVIITVKALHPDTLLDPLDREVAGLYAAEMGDGEDDYPDTPRRPLEEGQDPIHEAALDVFHDRVPIAVLDDFEVDTHTAPTEDDIPADVAWL